MICRIHPGYCNHSECAAVNRPAEQPPEVPAPDEVFVYVCAKCWPNQDLSEPQEGAPRPVPATQGSSQPKGEAGVPSCDSEELAKRVREWVAVTPSPPAMVADVDALLRMVAELTEQVGRERERGQFDFTRAENLKKERDRLALRGRIQFETIGVQLDHIRDLQQERDELRAKLATAEECFRVADSLHHAEWDKPSGISVSSCTRSWPHLTQR